MMPWLPNGPSSHRAFFRPSIFRGHRLVSGSVLHLQNQLNSCLFFWGGDVFAPCRTVPTMCLNKPAPTVEGIYLNLPNLAGPPPFALVTGSRITVTTRQQILKSTPAAYLEDHPS